MTTIFIVDDQEMIRVGLTSILSRHPGFHIIGDAADGFDALQQLASTPAEVVLMDIRMPGIDGVETTRRLREQWTAEQMRIVVLTTFEHDHTVIAALRAGANGYLSKAAGPDELVAAIEEISSGGGALSPTAAATLIERVAEERGPIVDEVLQARLQTLTPRECDIVRALATGRNPETIARDLVVSPYTVKTHTNRAMTKVGAHDRAQLVAFAYRGGLC